jgi:hypothetical protein
LALNEGTILGAGGKAIKTTSITITIMTTENIKARRIFRARAVSSSIKSPAGILQHPESHRGWHEIPVMFEIALSLYQAIPGSSGYKVLLLIWSACSIQTVQDPRQGRFPGKEPGYERGESR